MTFTISQVWAVILSICGGIVTISAAVSVALKIRQHFKKPNMEQNEQISKLWDEVTSLKKETNDTKEQFLAFFANDKKQLESIEEGNRVTQQALLALLSHGIDGNDTEALKSAKKALEKYLISR